GLFGRHGCSMVAGREHKIEITIPWPQRFSRFRGEGLGHFFVTTSAQKSYDLCYDLSRKKPRCNSVCYDVTTSRGDRYTPPPNRNPQLPLKSSPAVPLCSLRSLM